MKNILTLLLISFTCIVFGQQERPLQRQYKFRAHQDGYVPQDAPIGWYTDIYRKTDGKWYYKIEDQEFELLSITGIPGNDMDSDIALNDDQIGESYKILDDDDPEFTSTRPIIGDVDHNERGSILLTVPSTQEIVGGLNVIVEQLDGQSNSVDWVVSPNVTLRRGSNGGLYNIAAGQSSWSGGNATGTLWRNDEITTPTTFQNAYDGAIGDFITDPDYDNAYITDVATGIEYGPFTFLNWQQGGGGGFSVSDQTIIPSSFVPAWEVIDPRPEVRTANSTGNVFDPYLYEGIHDHLTIVNTESNQDLQVIGLENGNVDIDPEGMISIARVNGLWYREAVERSQSYVRTVQSVTYDLTQVDFGNATLLSVLADGPLTITHRDGINPLTNTTTTLLDGEIAYFGLSSVLGWIPLKISITKSGNVKIHASVGIIDNGGNNRITYLLKLIHKDSTGATIYEYMLDDTYIRDDNSLYDSGVMAGFVELGVDAGDTLTIQVFMLDTQTPAAVVNASTTFSKIIIQRRL